MENDDVNDGWEIVKTIELSGFDSGGEPEIRMMANGYIYVVFNFMPPSDAEDEDGDLGVFDEFDQEMAEAIGVEVIWEDREFFLIESPQADTVERISAFISGYRKQ